MKKNAQKFIGFDCNLSKVKGVSREKSSFSNSLHAMSFFFLNPFGLFVIVMFFKASLLKPILNILHSNWYLHMYFQSKCPKYCIMGKNCMYEIEQKISQYVARKTTLVYIVGEK